MIGVDVVTGGVATSLDEVVDPSAAAIGGGLTVGVAGVSDAEDCDGFTGDTGVTIDTVTLLFLECLGTTMA